MHIDKEAYQEAVEESLDKMKDYKHYLRFVELAGNSHLSARNLCAVLGANPEATEVGTLKHWNKRSFIIKAKEKAIQQGKKADEHTYPYIGTKEGLNQFLEYLNKRKRCF